VADFLLVNG